MSKPVNFNHNPHIRPICLPDPRPEYDISNGTEAVVAGWGKIGYTLGQSNILKGAKIKIVTNDKCQERYQRYKGSLKDTHLCAYGEGKFARSYFLSNRDFLKFPYF